MNLYFSSTCSFLVLSFKSFASYSFGIAPAALIKYDFSGVSTLTIFGYRAAQSIADNRRGFSEFLLNYK